MARKPKQSKRRGAQQGLPVNFWQMVRDVFVASINKGQFPIAIAGAIVLIIIWKMPPQDVSKLAFEILGTVASSSGIGYLFAVLFGCGWSVHAKWQRRNCELELKRVADERNHWQSKTLEIDIESSEG